jgi:hypothetical protein
LAIPLAPAATSENPKKPATSEIRKKIIAHLIMSIPFGYRKTRLRLQRDCGLALLQINRRREVEKPAS